MLVQEKNGFDPALPYGIDDFDLNGDGVPEWIVFQKPTTSCVTEASCSFYIAGLSTDKGLIALGKIQAGKIAVDTDRLYGIRKLFVYDNKNDDYDYRLYAWAPLEYSFRPLM